MLRRLYAFFLALCFGLFSVEALIADVHDGDASVGELTQYKSVQHSGASQFSSAVNLHTHSDSESPEHSGHSVHACHGAHAHSGIASVGPILGHFWGDKAAALNRFPDPRPSLKAPPKLRPPIA